MPRLREKKPLELVEVLVPDYRRLSHDRMDIHRRTDLVLHRSHYRRLLHDTCR